MLLLYFNDNSLLCYSLTRMNFLVMIVRMITSMNQELQHTYVWMETLTPDFKNPVTKMLNKKRLFSISGHLLAFLPDVAVVSRSWFPGSRWLVFVRAHSTMLIHRVMGTILGSTNGLRKDMRGKARVCLPPWVNGSTLLFHKAWPNRPFRSPAVVQATVSNSRLLSAAASWPYVSSSLGVRCTSDALLGAHDSCEEKANSDHFRGSFLIGIH